MKPETKTNKASAPLIQYRWNKWVFSLVLTTDSDWLLSTVLESEFQTHDVEWQKPRPAKTVV